MAATKTALLAGGGDVDAAALVRLLPTAWLTIGVDGGALVLERHGMRPDWVVGDFDSLAAADLERLQAAGAQVRRFPPAKDESDMEIALVLARELGASTVAILGATGNRLDHTVTNLAMLRRAVTLGLVAAIHAPGQEIRLLRPGRTTFAGALGQALSLVPLTPEVRGVVTTGLRFPLRGETLYLGRSRGIHNEFVGTEASVSLAVGELLVFLFAPMF